VLCFGSTAAAGVAVCCIPNSEESAARVLGFYRIQLPPTEATMSKLYIYENDNPNQNIPSKEGYRNVATNLLNDLANFRNATETQRSDLLRQYAGAKHTIFQLTRNPEQNVPIDSGNCKIKIENDERKKPAANFGKHNMVLPEMQAGDPPLNVGYLDKYVQAIDSLYGQGNPAEVLSACEFLFGIMLLTRCR
jgi:hypothetical protein